jgi:subtilase family serine protease
MVRSAWWRSALAAVAALAAVVAVSTSTAASPRAALAGSVPPWATSANFKGAAPSSDYVGFRVYLGWKNAAQAAALAQAVSDPKSSSYRKYLSPGQFRQQFAPSQSDVGAVQSWLRSQGMSVVYTPTNNHYVSAEGTVAQVQSAFGATLNEYSVAGTTLRAPATSLSVPSSLATIIASVVGIDQSQDLVHPDNIGPDAPPSAGFRVGHPCSSYWGELITSAPIPPAYGQQLPYTPCGYTPTQLRGAYGIAGSGYDGSGQTVAIIDAYASPTIVTDVNQFSTAFGLPTLSPSQFHQVVAPGTYRHPGSNAQDPQGWYGEETLDVEAVHEMAPRANIVYVGAPNNYQDLDAALNHVVDQKLAQIVTNSYGFSSEFLPVGYIKPYNDTFIQAAIEGIGLYFSSGDNGDETTNGTRTVDWPASSPWVTAVGGTSLGVGAANDYLFETGWSTGRAVLLGDNTWSTLPGVYFGGAGGGTSRLFAQPSYQAGVVPTSISQYFGGAPGRAVPDVADLADPNTGMLVGQTQTFPDGTYWDTYRIGGTSVASPLFAGVMALADQAAGAPHGFANPALYAQAGTSAFHDVVDPASTVATVRVNYVDNVSPAGGLAYSVRTMNVHTTIFTRPGYDDVTGVGSPNGAAFLNALK